MSAQQDGGCSVEQRIPINSEKGSKYSPIPNCSLHLQEEEQQQSKFRTPQPPGSFLQTMELAKQLAKKQLIGGVEEQPEKIIEKTCSLVHPTALPSYGPEIQYYSDCSSGPDSEEEFSTTIKEDSKDKSFYNFITEKKQKSQRGPSMSDTFHSLVDMEMFVEVVSPRSQQYLQKGVREIPFNLKPHIFLKKFSIDIYPNCQNIMKKLMNTQYKLGQQIRPLSLKTMDAPLLQSGKKVKNVLMEFQNSKDAIKMAEHLQTFRPKICEDFSLGYFETSLRKQNWVAVVVRNLQRGINQDFIMTNMHPPERKLNIRHVTQITKVRNQLCCLVVFKEIEEAEIFCRYFNKRVMHDLVLKAHLHPNSSTLRINPSKSQHDIFRKNTPKQEEIGNLDSLLTQLNPSKEPLVLERRKSHDEQDYQRTEENFVQRQRNYSQAFTENLHPQSHVAEMSNLERVSNSPNHHLHKDHGEEEVKKADTNKQSQPAPAQDDDDLLLLKSIGVKEKVPTPKKPTTGILDSLLGSVKPKKRETKEQRKKTLN